MSIFKILVILFDNYLRTLNGNLPSFHSIQARDQVNPRGRGYNRGRNSARPYRRSYRSRPYSY